MVLGELSPQRSQAIEQAFKKYDSNGKGFASYRVLREAFDARKHPDVVNGRKIPDEVVTDFLEILEIHHNSYNGFKKTDNVSKDEFTEFYRTVSPNYDDDFTFSQMVRGVWGIKNDVMSQSYA